MSTRRNVLKAVAIAPAVATGQSPANKPKVFTADELLFVGKLADAIIPPSDTPGASEAGVPLFIDRRIGARAKEFRAGMKSLDDLAKSQTGRGFLALSGPQVDELVTPIADDPSTPAGAFFVMVKNFTIDGYYSTREGLSRELGWNANTYLPEFNGCTHEEHR